MTTMIAKSQLEALSVEMPAVRRDSGASTARRTSHGNAILTVAEMMSRYVGLRVVMIDCHDQLIGRLMELPSSIVDMALVRYDPHCHGAPSIEVIDTILEGLEDEACLGPCVDTLA